MAVLPASARATGRHRLRYDLPAKAAMSPLRLAMLPFHAFAVLPCVLVMTLTAFTPHAFATLPITIAVIDLGDVFLHRHRNGWGLHSRNRRDGKR
jgi:hypothetical protein